MAKQTAYNNIAGLQKALKRLPKLATDRLRDAAQSIAGDVAGEARGRANRVGGVARLVAPTIKGTRDRVPVIRMGATGRLPNRTGANQANQTIGNVIWGAEYGGRRRATTQQFGPFRGSGRGAGYFVWPAVDARSDQIMDEYSQALADALKAI